MRIGRTISAKRDEVQSESERMIHREKVKRRKLISVVTFLAVVALVGLGAFTALYGMRRKEPSVQSGTSEVVAAAPIIDEASAGVPKKVKDFVGFLEQDLKEYGIILTKAVLPRNKSREVDVYIGDFEGYFKLSLDRGAGVSAEDMERMLRYLKGQGIIGAEYVDLRVEGKGYYKGEKHPEQPEQGAEEQGSTPEENTEATPEDENSSVFVREGESNGEEEPEEVPVYVEDFEGE